MTYGQDRIFFKNGKELNVKIVEKSDKEVKYRLTDEKDSPMITLNSRTIDKIIFRNGEEMKLTPEGTRMAKRICINAGIMSAFGFEDAYYKFQADYFITPYLNFDINGLIGIESGDGYTAGLNYYFNQYNPQMIKLYTGLQVGFLNNDFNLQIPVGLNLTLKKGFDMKLGLIDVFYPNEKIVNRNNIYYELLIGWRF